MLHTPPLIVIADSDIVYLGFMQELLIEEGYEVLVAESGANAYRLIREKRADMAILDIPIMNPDAPMTTLTMLQLDPTTKHIPVLICSTNTHLIRENVAHFQEMGCALLTKPFSLEQMTGKIQTSLAQSQRNVTDGNETIFF